MNKTILTLISVIATASPFASAQMTLNKYGKMEIGTCDELSSWNVQSNLLDTITSLGIYGNGSMGINGRISFGDHSSLGAMNVFIGEVQGGDTDQLWLHGKKGMFYTAGPHATDTIVSYDLNQDGVFIFNCDVKGNGFFVASDSRFKENIEPISNALETVNEMTAVSYNFKSPSTARTISKAASYNTTGTTAKELQDKEFFDKYYANKANNRTPRYGFIAQDIKKVCPELVHTDKNGYNYVDYIGVVPILVEAIKELKEELAEIKNNSDILKASNASTTSQQSIDYSISRPALFQNAPNPFNAETRIKYVLPESVTSAALYIFDMQGKQIKCITIKDRGESSVTIKAAELSAGMYVYTLIADGSEVSSYRMILTK